MINKIITLLYMFNVILCILTRVEGRREHLGASVDVKVV